MGILEQLRKKQREAGLVAPANPEAPVEIPGWKPQGFNKALVPINPSGQGVPSEPLTTLPTPAQPPHQKTVETAFDVGSHRGYIKLFPPTVQTLRDLKPEWIAENWTKPSPWCAIEGQPNHPEFEKNMKGLE